MCKPLTGRLFLATAAAVLVAGLAGAARAEVVLVHLQTDYAPVADFAGVHVRFASLDPGVVLFADHLALGSRDYATGWVRVAEFDAPFGNYLLTVDLLAGDGDIVARWSTLTEFDAPRVYSVEAPKPWGWAEKSVELEIDADGDGAISGGDRLRYTVEAQGRVGRSFTDELGPGLELVAGSVSTTHGLVLEGNSEADRRVEIVEMNFGDTDSAIVEFEATVLPEVANQGEILVELGSYTPGSWSGQYASARIATDDPATSTPGDPTRSAVACGTAACQEDLDACTEELGDCSAERAALAARVADLEAELGALLDDADGDAVPAVADACTGTAAGVAVDALGCSLAQFCSAHPLGVPQGMNRCRHADWENDEPTGNPHDCRPQSGLCVPD